MPGLQFDIVSEMEAAGIEPASQSTSGTASTCVVGHLNLDLRDADRQASRASRPEVFSPRPFRSAGRSQPA